MANGEDADALARQLKIQLVRGLRDAACPSDAKAMAAYMKHKFSFFGVKAPTRRSLLSGTLREHNKQEL